MSWKEGVFPDAAPGFLTGKYKDHKGANSVSLRLNQTIWGEIGTEIRQSREEVVFKFLYIQGSPGGNNCNDEKLCFFFHKGAVNSYLTWVKVLFLHRFSHTMHIKKKTFFFF